MRMSPRAAHAAALRHGGRRCPAAAGAGEINAPAARESQRSEWLELAARLRRAALPRFASTP
jgi:hypothetical protein